MTEPTLEALTQRLERLKREVRWCRALGSAALTTVGLLVLLGATGAKGAEEVRARRFLLTDKDGTIRAALGMVDGSPRLEIYNQAGKRRIWLGVDANGLPGLLFKDKDERTRASLDVQPDGSPALSLADKDGKLQAVLGSPEGTPVFELLDREGKVIWKAP